MLLSCLYSSEKWEFNLIEDDKTVNAWVMPGGKAAVYTGILPYTGNETGLAVVLGHEVAHALADHGNERMSQMNKQDGQRPPQFLSTHPAPETRIADIKKYIPEALPYYEKSTK